MRFNTLFFLLILSCLCLALAHVAYEDCCLKYVQKAKHVTRHAVKYRYQKTDGGCNIPAVIFTLRKGRIVCADPEKSWVIDLVTKLNNKEAQRDNKRLSNRG